MHTNALNINYIVLGGGFTYFNRYKKQPNITELIKSN